MLLPSLLLLTAIQQGDVPMERLDQPWWKSRHELMLERTKAGNADLLFVGDSITQGWEGGGKQVWQTYYAHRNAVNFGISADCTNHVLWRLANGEMKGLHPKVIVVMIGTNNLGQGVSDVSGTVIGVKAVVEGLRQAMPNAKILLLGVFPRGLLPTDAIRKNVDDVNTQISQFASEPGVSYLDIGYAFKSRGGVLWQGLMPDLLHPNAAGYQVWAKAMEPDLAKLMGDQPVRESNR